MKEIKYNYIKKDHSEKEDSKDFYYNGETIHFQDWESDEYVRIDIEEIKDFSKIEGPRKAIENVKELYVTADKLKLRGINKFKNLETAVLEGNITEIEGLNGLRHLRKLHLSKNKIREIKGLETLNNLEMLDLSANKINSIKGLDELSNLKDLNLNFNKIWKISGLDNLINLREMHLISNKICRIEGLDNLKNLGILELRDNYITKLSGLGNLESLGVLSLETKNVDCQFAGLDHLGGFDQHGWAVHPQKWVKYCKKKSNETLSKI